MQKNISKNCEGESNSTIGDTTILINSKSKRNTKDFALKEHVNESFLQNWLESHTLRRVNKMGVVEVTCPMKINKSTWNHTYVFKNQIPSSDI